MSPFPNSKQKWLKNVEAAEALAVDVRTIKRWMKQQDTREALSAVGHGKQWRIPRPADISLWEAETRERFIDLGFPIKPTLERDLKKLDKECDRYLLETYRLWLAANAAVLERRRITQQDRDSIILLWQTAGEILNPLSRLEMQVDKLQPQFRAKLLSRGLKKHEVDSILRYWPAERHFKQVRDAYTLEGLEALRRRLDYTQATRDLEESDQKPTTENIRPLLHHDIMAHINDTRDQLRGVARQPQAGLARRTAQKRHPQKQYPQKSIVAEVYQIRDSIPGSDGKPQISMTPRRRPVDDVPGLV